jgi:hypothetical protein
MASIKEKHRLLSRCLDNALFRPDTLLGAMRTPKASIVVKTIANHNQNVNIQFIWI